MHCFGRQANTDPMKANIYSGIDVGQKRQRVENREWLEHHRDDLPEWQRVSMMANRKMALVTE